MAKIKSNLLKMTFSWLTLMLFLILVLAPWELFFKGGISLSSMAAPISWSHWLGADNLGRDLLMRIASAVKGAVLPIWFSATLFSLLGICCGFFALVLAQHNAFLKNLVFSSKMLAALLASIPLSIAVFFIVVWQESAGIWPVLISLGALFSFRCYLQMFNLFDEDHKLAYWQAHVSIGGSLSERLFRYGIKGRWGERLFSSYCFHLQVAVTIEASLSYLGFGVQEPQASFGNMLASHFDMYLKGHWQIMVVIVLAMLLVTQVPRSLFTVFSSHLRSLLSSHGRKGSPYVRGS